MKVVLRGYFGRGNFGDDILMRVVHSMVTERLPGTPILVSGAEPSSYIHSHLGRAVEVCASRVDLVEPHILIYAGGGQFFGFRRKIRPELARQLALRLAGISVAARLSGLVAKKAMPASLRMRVGTAGVGLGIGPFLLGSESEYAAAQALAECTFLHVRDSESRRWCRMWRLPVDVLVSPDMSLVFDRWLSEWPDRKRSRHARTVGIIIRGWKYGTATGWLEGLTAAMERLRHRGIAVQPISFCPKDDESMVRTYFASENVISYDPNCSTPAEFCAVLAECHALVSARAHGVYAAAVLSIPSVAVVIEPKLSIAAHVVGAGCMEWSSPFDPDDLVETVEKALDDRSALSKEMQRGLVNRRSSVQSASRAFQGWLGTF